MNDYSNALVAIVGLIGTAVGAWFGHLSKREEHEANTDLAIIERWEQLQEHIREKDQTIVTLLNEISDLKSEIVKLTMIVKTLEQNLKTISDKGQI